MTQAYPIILTTEKKGGFSVYIPDFTINTQGETLEECIEMARDAMGIMGIDMEDENEALPVPSGIRLVKPDSSEDIVTLVDVDFTAYRREHEQRTVRKNCSLPSWLNSEAEKAGLNFSALLQSAIKTELNISP